MNECEAMEAVDASSPLEGASEFLTAVLRALLGGSAAFPAAAAKSAASSYRDEERRLRFLETQGIVTHKRSIQSGHLVPEFGIGSRQASNRARDRDCIAYVHIPGPGLPPRY
jgi:hypothetical protein